MYYYAILNADDICIDIYAMPVQISGDSVVAISSNDQSLIGQRYNRAGAYFEPLYYYAVLNEKGVVTETVYRETQEQTSNTFRAITFAQYQTVKGLYWNGTDYVTPPISIAAVASTDEVNYKDQDKWLSTKLDEMDTDISANESDISTLSTNLSTVVTSLQAVSQSLAALATSVDGKAEAVHGHTISDITGLDDALTALDGEITGLQTVANGKANAVHTHSVSDVAGLTATLDGFNADIGNLETAVSGKANAAHTHTAASLSGVVKTVNGNAPDASGNIVVTSGGMTADEILTALKTVDGSGSGLDADKLDGKEAADFAAANHNHDAAYAPKTHTHAQYLTEDDIDLSGYATTSAMNTALAGKSDTTHNHNATYAPIAHTHTMENVTGLATALAGKSNTNHNHNTAYAAISHAHEIANITGLSTALAGKSDSTHNHDKAYAAINHTHTGYATTASVTALGTAVSELEDDVAGKAEATHSHAQSDVTGLTAALNGKANSSHTHAQSDITGLATALNGKANTSHTHAISNVTGLQTALDGKAASSHTHTISNVTGLQSALDGKAASSHTHDYLPTSGGTVDGNVNVNGIVRVNNQQCLYDSGSMVTVSTNNRETMIAGSKIYSKVAISTSSDARLKENVQPAPIADLISMIKRLEVKKFNYKGNNEKNIGIIAQDFIYNNPTYISDIYIRQCCEDGMFSFKDTELVYALVAAVQDIYNRIDN